ncbi:MAG: bifunctional glutamate N-acetyltransferase/amino-acid acetyltransferase ArgJ [Puniceicoccaceae bacterium]
MNGFKYSEASKGCVDATGFRIAGVHCDVRNKADERLDLALLISDEPATVAGVFTRNRVAAAPVRLGRDLLSKGGLYRGFVANSGNANACTGENGMEDAQLMQAAVATAAGCSPNEVFVCSTGRIGKRLPMERIVCGIAEAAAKLDDTAEAGLRAADAILTSDTRRKVCTVEVKTESGSVTIGGMAKGAGMIEPNMATMLAFICTDAEVAQADLQRLLSESVKATFNAVTVDGDESTNDTVLVFANGASGMKLSPGHPDWSSFKAALSAVCHDLAQKIVGDGEKITKVVEVCIDGAANDTEAEMAARAIANSLLVKSSWYGNDPNWGRLMDALGYSGAAMEEDTISIHYAPLEGDPVPAFIKGTIHEDRLEDWKTIVAAKKFCIQVNLGQGSGSSRVWSTDLTEGYVNFNKSE